MAGVSAKRFKELEENVKGLRTDVEKLLSARKWLVTIIVPVVLALLKALGINLPSP
jgi:hypothetical protein